MGMEEEGLARNEQEELRGEAAGKAAPPPSL